MPSSDMPAPSLAAESEPLSPTESAESQSQLPPGISGPPGLLLKLIKDQRVAFLIVGGINTVVGTLWYALFFFLLHPFSDQYGKYIALVPTYIASILCAFFLYRKIVFRVSGHVLRDLVRFSSVYLTVFLINFPIMGLATKLGMHPVVAQIVNTGIVTVSSFIFHKRFSFKRTPSELGSQES